jgi:hypothetical protein
MAASYTHLAATYMTTSAATHVAAAMTATPMRGESQRGH